MNKEEQVIEEDSVKNTKDKKYMSIVLDMSKDADLIQRISLVAKLLNISTRDMISGYVNSSEVTSRLKKTISELSI